MPTLPVCAILDDYQDCALGMADWSRLDGMYTLRRYGSQLGHEDDVARALSDCRVVVAMRERTPFPQRLLQRLPDLKLLVTTGGRNRSIDLNAARALGISVCGTRSEGSGAAELAWAGLMAYMRNIPHETENLRGKGPWQTGVGRSLHGKRLGIVGLGKLGSQMAAFGKVFGMDVCGWTRTDPVARAVELGISAIDLPELFSTCDAITLHLTLNDATRGLVSAELLARMRADAVLVNTARGPIVDEAALISLLRAGRIGGAVLDVYDTEPLPEDHPFRTLPNVLATPHIGYVTQENYRTYYADAVEDILCWHAGRSLRVLA